MQWVNMYGEGAFSSEIKINRILGSLNIPLNVKLKRANNGRKPLDGKKKHTSNMRILICNI